MAENKIYGKLAYKCGICGQEHSSVQDRMNCEMACLKKQQEEEKRAAEAKKKAEKDARKAEVDQAITDATKLYRSYINDYSYYEYEGEASDSNDIDNFLWPSKFWHYFL